MDTDTAVLPEEMPLETEAQAAPAETQSTETETPVSPFSGKSFDEIAEDPEVARVIKDRLAKQGESLRQKAENERQKALEAEQARVYQQQRNQAAAASTQWAARAFKTAAEQSSDGSLGSETVEWVAGQLNAAALLGANEAFRATAEEYLGRNHPEFRIPQDLNRQFATAQSRQDIPGMMVALMGVLEAAQRDKLSTAIRAEIEAELAKETEVETERKAAGTQKTAPKPTSAGANPPPARNLRDILLDPMASAADKAKAFRQLHPDAA